MPRPAAAVPAMIAAISLLLVGCTERPGFDQTQYGIVTVMQIPRDGNEFDAEPTAIFFLAERSPLPTSADQSSVCSIAPASPPASTPGFEPITAGDSIPVTAAGATVWLRPTTEAGLTRYARVDDPPLVVSPGEQIQVVVAGDAGGFPAASVTVSALAPIAFESVGIPDDGQPLPVSWAPAGTAGTRVRIALRYTPAGAAAEEIVCHVPDTGSFVIPVEFLADWREAPADSRNGIGSRWQSEQTVRGESVLAAYVQVESPIPMAP